MKIKHLFVAAMTATLGFASCTQTDLADSGVDTGEKAKLTIKIAAPVTSRATGVSTDNTDNTINNYVAFVFKANGDMEEKIVSLTAATAQSTQVTTAAREVYVVANAPATLFDGVTNKATLLTVLGDLATSQGVASQTSTAGGNVWASGVAALTPDLFIHNSTTNVYEISVPVTLTFVSAKINVTVDNQMTNQAALGALTITNVAVLNAVTQTKFFGLSLMPASVNYYAGLSETGFSIAPLGCTEQSFLQDNYTAGTGNHYYVFENNSDVYPVIVTLVATYGAKTRYFPVHFVGADAGFPVVRGNMYNLNIKLTGNADPDAGDVDPGTDDPTNPVVAANMTVSVTASSWTPKVINKTF